MKHLKTLFILCIITVLLFSIPSQKHPTAYADMSSTQVMVVASNLNVRDEPTQLGKIIDLVHQGDAFEVIQSKNNWIQIKTSGSQTGWVSNRFVTPIENISGTVEVNILNVRKSPSLSSQIIGKLTLGTKITIQAEQSGWAKIVSSDGTKGWVFQTYISEGETNNRPAFEAAKEKLTTTVQNGDGPLNGKTIVLDPGHGGADNGTTSIVGTPEKALTLATAQVVKRKLESAGANVILTRTDDTYIPLEQRAAVSNNNHADAFISFHYNWIQDPAKNGLTDFYYQKEKDSTLASDLLNEVVKTTGLNNLGTRFDDLSVLRNNTQPCTLIELGFLSSSWEDSIVESSSYREQVAQGVYLGLLDYFSK